MGLMFAGAAILLIGMALGAFGLLALAAARLDANDEEL